MKAPEHDQNPEYLIGAKAVVKLNLEKKWPYVSGARPNHYMKELGTTVIGCIVFDSGEVGPGQTASARIEYVYTDALKKILKPGLLYELREGSKTVGSVEILEVESRVKNRNGEGKLWIKP